MTSIKTEKVSAFMELISNKCVLTKQDCQAFTEQDKYIHITDKYIYLVSSCDSGIGTK